MSIKALKPEDILPDKADFVEIGPNKIRKGTIAAALGNANILMNPNATEEEKLQAMDALKKLAPDLISVEMHKHVTWKNPIIQQIIDNALVAAEQQEDLKD